jgi:hypothetical protein
MSPVIITGQYVGIPDLQAVPLYNSTNLMANEITPITSTHLSNIKDKLKVLQVLLCVVTPVQNNILRHAQGLHHMSAFQNS